jgi:alpha-glucosidase
MAEKASRELNNQGIKMSEPWWKTGVIYQIYPRSFKDTSGNGIGDLQGIMEKLDYLNDGTEASLGIDIIWLNPINPSPQVDFGYDVSDYCEIDPLFGDLSIFKELIEALHKHGIRILMDLVLNHTSDQHPWFIESRSDLHNPKRDWYIWHPGNQGKPPNNWSSYFGGRAWHLDSKTSQYFLAMFAPEQPDLNWRNPDVKSALFDVMRFWLDQGVDGFRLDVFNQYFKDAKFRSNPINWNPLGIVHSFWGQHHIYDRDQPEIFPMLSEMRGLIDSYPERMMIGEIVADVDSTKTFEYYGSQHDGLNLAYNFDLFRAKWSPRHFRRVIRKWEAHQQARVWPTYVLSNHDVPRHFSRYDKRSQGLARAKVAAAMLLMLRGTPMLYYGEELGQAEVKLLKKQIMDPPGVRYWPFHKGRDGCRAPMQWDDSIYAGFTTGSPWLPVHTDSKTKNVKAQERDPESLLNLYRRLIWLRKKHPVLQSGDLVLVDKDHRHVLAFSRFLEDERIFVLLNFSFKNQSIILDASPPLKTLFGTHKREGEMISGKGVELQPNEVLILKQMVESGRGPHEE